MSVDVQPPKAAEQLAPPVIYVVQGGADTTAPAELTRAQILDRVVPNLWIIGSLTLAATVAALLYAITATSWYRAEAVLLPREAAPVSTLSRSLAPLGGLAEIAGISMGSGSRQEPLGILMSKGFAARFIEKQGLVPVLDAEFGHGILDRILGSATPPDLNGTADAFVREVLSVAEDRKTGLVTVAIEWKDREVAASWANALVVQLNTEMRERALAEATANLTYLRGQLKEVREVSLQEALAGLIESEMRKAMLAQGLDDYAVRVIDSARPPVRQVRPRRGFIIAGTFLVALVVTTVLTAAFRQGRAVPAKDQSADPA